MTVELKAAKLGFQLVGDSVDTLVVKMVDASAWKRAVGLVEMLVVAKVDELVEK